MPTLDRLSRSHLCCMTRVALSLDIILERSIAMSSMHFLYKYHTLLFSFLYFLLKHTVRVLPSSLLETTPFSWCIHHHRPFSVHFIDLVSTLFFKSLFYLKIYIFYFPRLYTLVTLFRPVKVLRFVVTCRQCLVRQVTSQLFVTEQITRKYTYQVIKTKRVQAKRGVRPPFPRPQQMRIWRWLT